MKKLIAPLQKKKVKKTVYYSLAVSLAFALGNFISSGDEPILVATEIQNTPIIQEEFSAQ